MNRVREHTMVRVLWLTTTQTTTACATMPTLTRPWLVSKHVAIKKTTGSTQDVCAAAAQAMQPLSGQRPGVAIKKTGGIPPDVALSVEPDK